MCQLKLELSYGLKRTSQVIRIPIFVTMYKKGYMNAIFNENRVLTDSFQCKSGLALFYVIFIMQKAHLDVIH